MPSGTVFARHLKNLIWNFKVKKQMIVLKSTRCVPTLTKLDSYLHSTSYNKPDVEIENILVI
jgi:hypothetical protein